MSDEIGIVFAAPAPPRVYDLALVFANVTQPRFRRDPAGAEDVHDLVALERVPPEFGADDVREAQDWLGRTIVGDAARGSTWHRLSVRPKTWEWRSPPCAACCS